MGDEQYAASSLMVNARRRLTTDYAASNFYEDLAGISISPSAQKIVEFACGDGMFLRRLHACHPIGKVMLGIDKSTGIISQAASEASLEINASNPVNIDGQVPREDAPSVVIFKNGDITADLDEENIYDVGFMNFVLYHLDDPNKAIDNLVQVVKEDGLIVVSARSEGYQQRVWGDAQRVLDERFPDFCTPENWYKNFDIEDTFGAMDKRTTVQGELEQVSKLKIPPAGWGIYQWAVGSILHSMEPRDQNHPVDGPRPKQLLDAVEEVLKEDFDREVDSQGYYEDRIVQKAFICVNNKKD